MASGKASKRKRAQGAQPPPVRSAGGGGVAVDRRLWVLGAVVLAILVAVVAAALLTRGGDEPAADGATLTDAAEAIALFEGIPQEGVVLGEPDAPVTIIEFADLQCPFCREFAVQSVPEVIEKHVRTGKAKLELRGLAFLGPDSVRGMKAALAAARQNRLWEFTELLYYNQGGENTGWLSQDLVEAAARSLPGVDVGRLVSDMNSGAVSDLLDEHAAEAERRGVTGTPTILVGPTGGELRRVELQSMTDVASIDEAVAAASS